MFSQFTHRGRLARRVAIAVRSGVVGLALLAAGCSKKTTAPEIDISPPTTDGFYVTWSTSVNTRGCVRYGYTRGSFDHMAYPVAAGRRDKQLRQDHEVPLLDLRVGQWLYYQPVNEIADGTRSFGALDSFEVMAILNRPLLTSTMIHIGFGDSHVITMPNGKRLLIDGGEQAAASSVEQYFIAHGIAGVDAMLATHIHLDHMGGIGGFGSNDTGALLRWANPSVYFDSPQKSGSRTIYNTVLAHIAATPTRAVVLLRGDTSHTVPDLDLDPAVTIRVLNSGRLPAPPYGSSENDQINNDSMVLKFSYGDVDFVIGGDAESEAEASMVAAFAGQLDVEYYKAHHHGLPDGSSQTWVSALNPRVCFIPNTQLVWNPPGEFVGAISSTTNKIRGVGGHVYIIDEAEAMGVQRSSRQYNVTFATDGRSYEVSIEWAHQSTPNLVSSHAQECMMTPHASAEQWAPSQEEAP